ncbi:hypothetical protein M9458_001069, partial [Cirrhinus mrigala]
LSLMLRCRVRRSVRFTWWTWQEAREPMPQGPLVSGSKRVAISTNHWSPWAMSSQPW